MTTFEKIQKIIVEQLDLRPEDVKPETSMQDGLDADSLDIFQIINDIEDEFDITIDEDEVDLKTIQDIVDFVDQKQ